MLTITRYIVVPDAGTIHCYYDSDGTAPVAIGSNLHAQLSEAETPLDSDAWSNDDLCHALAAHVGVPREQVRVAPVPPEPDPEPSDEA